MSALNREDFIKGTLGAFVVGGAAAAGRTIPAIAAAGRNSAGGLSFSSLAPRTSPLVVPRPKHVVDARPMCKMAVRAIKGFARRPDGSMPERYEADHDVAAAHVVLGTRQPQIQPTQCGGNLCSTPSPHKPDFSISQQNGTAYAYNSQNYREIYYKGQLQAQYYIESPVNGTNVNYRFIANGHDISGTSIGTHTFKDNTVFTLPGSNHPRIGINVGARLMYAFDDNNWGAGLSWNPTQPFGPSPVDFVSQDPNVLGINMGTINCAVDFIAGFVADLGIVLVAAGLTSIACVGTEGILCGAVGLLLGDVAGHGIEAVSTYMRDDCLANLEF